jgi:hypothetical protein
MARVPPPATSGNPIAPLLDAIAHVVREQVEAALEEHQPAPRDASPLLDRAGAARFLGVSLTQLDRLTRERGVPVHRVGDVRRYDVDELRRWVLAQPSDREDAR